MHFINFQFEYDMHVHNHQSPRIQSAWLISVYEDGCFTRNWIYGDCEGFTQLSYAESRQTTWTRLFSFLFH